MHPLDGIRVDVRGDHLHRRRQVQNHRVFWSWFHDGNHCVADFLGVVHLGAREGLGGVLPAPVGVWVIHGDGLDQLSCIRCQLLDGLAILAEHHAALQLRGGIVEVDDDVLRAFTRLECAADEVLARLNQNLDGHVLGDAATLDDLADEIEIRLGRGGEAHLDFLVAHLHQQIEHPALALGAHGINQGLVAIAQIHRTPLGSAVDDLIWPGAIRQGDVIDFFEEWQVAGIAHLRIALLVPCGLAIGDVAVWSVDGSGGGDECVVHEKRGSWKVCGVSRFPTGSTYSATGCRSERKFRPEPRRGAEGERRRGMRTCRSL